MGINGVGSFYAQDYDVPNRGRATRGKTSGDDFASMGSATSLSESSDNGKRIGLTAVGNVGYIAMYADSSTEQDPIVKVGDYEVRVKDVDPNNATKMEMFALLSYMDDKGLTNNTGMKSFNKMTAYSSQAEYNGYCGGIYDENAAWTVERDWIGILGNAKETFFSIPQTYNQGLECEKIIENLKKWSDTSSDDENTDYQKILSERKNEIYEKVKNGDTEESFQIGGSSFTEKEWDKLLAEVDDITEEMREAMREEHEKRFAEAVEEKSVKQTENMDSTDAISKLFDTENTDIIDSADNTSKEISARVYSAEELQEAIDKEVQSNQYKKKSLYEMLMDSCPEGTNATFRFAGESKIYSFYEYIEELERRSAESHGNV